MKRLALIAVLLWPVLTAGSCATTREPQVRPVEVRVPVPVPCVVNIGPEPTYADNDDALRRRDGEAPEAHVIRTFPLLVAGRLQRIGRDREKSAAIAACQ